MGKNRNKPQSTETTVRLDPATERFVQGQLRPGALQARDTALNTANPFFLGPNDATLQALQGLGQGIDFGLGRANPLQVSAGFPGGGFPGVDAAQVADIGGFGFSPGSLDTNRIQDFFNPFESSVISGLQSDFDRQRTQALQAAANQATAAGAFGGSRGEVLASEALGGVNQQESSALAQTRSQGFNTALQSALQEFQLQQTLGLQGALGGQELALQRALGQAGFDQQAALANQQAGLQGLGLDLQAQLANQQAGLQAFGLDLQSAQSQAALNQSRLQQQAGIGELVRQIQQAQAQEPLFRQQQAQNFLSQGIGPFGQTSTATSQGGGGGNFLSGLLGGALTGFGATGNPFGAIGGGLLGGLFG